MPDDNDYHYRQRRPKGLREDVGRRSLPLRFIAYLQQKRLKTTQQRLIILEEFLCQDDHVSAEELHDRMKIRQPGIGQATVFRTMRLIAEAGIAQIVSIDQRTTRYERRTDGTHHDHIKCIGCNTVFEFYDERMEKLHQEIATRYDVHLISHRMDLFGLCKNCRSTQESEA